MTSLAITDYRQLSDIDHALQRPGLFIGSTDRQIRKALCYSTELKRITEKDVYLAEGQEQTFLEILGNAADNVQRSRDHGVDPGRIEVLVTKEWVVVKNYGMNIPVAQDENGTWIPDMIFGRLRTSSNYDDSKQRFHIGMNGLGAKATNIYSLVFVIECADPMRGLYTQTWQQNMRQRGEPVIKPYSGVGYTQVGYSLDFARFGVTEFDQEAMEIYAAHCAAVSLTCQVPVIFNGETFNIKDIVSYAALFFPITRQSAISHSSPDGSYNLCLVDTPNSAICVSFVNGILTKAHGVHVDAAYKVIVDSVKAFLGKAVEGVTITKRDIVNHVSLFLTCRLPNPQFKSQTKECLAKPKPDISLPEEVLKGIKRWQLVEQLYMEIHRKQINKLKKTDGKRRKRINNDNLQDANFAKDSNPDRRLQTTLIVVEGESAASYPVKFISQIPNNCGRNYFGILPLHGKLLNVLNADFIQILENRDLAAIKEALGLEEEVDYTDERNFRRLRYGNFLFIPDADNDGKHILGLVLVFFLARFPSLVQRGFFKFLRTPVIRVTGHGQRYIFYTYSSYLRWAATVPDINNKSAWRHDYFKGLGTSEDHHIQEDFQLRKIVTFKIDERAGERIVLAFRKEAAQDRKQWLADLVDHKMMEVESFDEIPISIFVDYELIDYSVENIIRSIPEQMDGMKESQRKAFFAALNKLKGKGKVKVAQIASHAAEITCYKHGEGSLADAIKLMTFHFVGSNNMPYFVPRGQFGCVDPDTPILCWDGSIKLAREITTDDLLVGDDGKPRRISRIVRGYDTMYEVRQKYGMSYRVNDRHILTLEKRKKSCFTQESEIVDINIQTFLSLPPAQQRLYRSAHNTQPIEWPKREVKTDPYVIGIRFEEEKEDLLREYIINDVETRLQLLAGLVDKFGCLLNGDYIIFIFDYIELAKFLAQSLGFKAVHSASLKISGEIWRIPSRKYNVPKSRKRYFGSRIEIKQLDLGEYVGWYLDGNERFLLGDFTITHNTRNKGGKDAANPRYTYISLPWWTNKVFRKEDKRLERRIIDEGEERECENFFPILPMHVINGVVGIGTAYSTNIPAHNPLDVAFWLQQRLLQDLDPDGNHQLPLLRPWYKGFTGEIRLKGNGFTTEGRMRIQSNGSIIIDELPIGTWTKDYENFLLKLEGEGVISDFDSYSTSDRAYFVIHRYMDGNPTPKKLKLITKHSYSNMTVLYRTESRGIKPVTYSNLHDLLQDYYKYRLEKYAERKALVIKEIKQEIKDLGERARFILTVIEGKLIVHNRPEKEIFENMTKMGFDHKLLDLVKTREFTRERVEALQSKIRDRQTERERLKEIRPEQLWYQELEEFISEYCRREKCQRSTFESCNPPITLTIERV